VTIRYRFEKNGTEYVLTATPVGLPMSVHTREAGATDIHAALDKDIKEAFFGKPDNPRPPPQGYTLSRYDIVAELSHQVSGRVRPRRDPDNPGWILIAVSPHGSGGQTIFWAFDREAEKKEKPHVECEECGNDYVEGRCPHKVEPRYDTTEATVILLKARISLLECQVKGTDAALGSVMEERDKLRAREAPEQAWARAATLMRSAIQTHGKLADDDPAWGIDIPEYRPPEAP